MSPRSSLSVRLTFRTGNCGWGSQHGPGRGVLRQQHSVISAQHSCICLAFQPAACWLACAAGWAGACWGVLGTRRRLAAWGYHLRSPLVCQSSGSLIMYAYRPDLGVITTTVQYMACPVCIVADSIDSSAGHVIAVLFRLFKHANVIMYLHARACKRLQVNVMA